MHSKLTNLLPSDRMRSNRRAYFLRFGAVSFITLAILVVVHGILLFPSYVYLGGQVTSKQIELKTLSSAAPVSQSQAVKQLAALRTDAQYLSSVGNAPTVSSAIRLLLSLPHLGIQLSGFSYTPDPTAGAARHMIIHGTAITREALRSYDQTLQAAPWIKNADLPISAYAKETNIDFTIDLTGSFTSS
jgi:hypothetical protein